MFDTHIEYNYLVLARNNWRDRSHNKV